MILKRIEFNTDGSKGPPIVKACYLCSLRPSKCGFPLYCSDKYYTLLEEPEEIQSEYDHKKERYELLKNKAPFSEEVDGLEKWLKDNPKECWVQCSRKNTKAGDKVRHHADENVNYIIEQIYREYESCTVWNIELEKTVLNYILGEFEINIHKQGDR